MSPGPATPKVTLGKVGAVLEHWDVSDPPEFARPGQCVWPLDDRPFCGEPTGSPVAPYCPDHAAMARQASAPKAAP